MTTLYARLIAAALLVAALLFGWHALTSHYDSIGYARAREEARIASAAQAERMRDLQRQAEKKYVVQQGERERFIVTTVKELSDAAAPLADCRVPADVSVRLNAIRSCALGDSASCGSPDGAVPKP